MDFLFSNTSRLWKSGGSTGPPVQVSNVRRLVVDAGRKEIIVQTGEPDGIEGSRYRTFRIAAVLEENKAYKVTGEFTSTGTAVRVRDITEGSEREVAASISEIEGYRKRGWP